MGTLEEINKKLIRRTKVQEAILTTLSTAGVLTVALLAPNALKALHNLGILPHLRRRDVVLSAIGRLRKEGLLVFKNGHYSLTELGQKTLSRWHLSNYQIKKPKRWDRKWRIIIFDIPETKRKVRAEVRQILTKMGLYRLQDSVWVFPYDCEDVIGLLKIDFRINQDLLYVIADQIENDKYLRQEFNLS